MIKHTQYLTLPLFLLAYNSYAADFITISESNFMNYMQVDKNKGLTVTDKDNSYKLLKSVTLPNGTIKNKYVQYYKGIPVFATHISNSEKNGGLQQWWGKYLKNISTDIPSITPSLTKQQALNKAITSAAVSSQNLRNEQVNAFIMLDKNTHKARLVYFVSFVSEQGNKVTRPTMIIDANKGEIINKWDGLTTRDATGPGGNEKTGEYYYGKDFNPMEVTDACEMKTEHVETYNMNNLEYGGELFKFTCPENTYKKANGAYSPLNDAHFFGNVSFEMFNNWYNIAPINSTLKLRVHYGDEFENAFWDGEVMTFGDGADFLYPLVSLDVVAHELSHGVTEQNSGLIYQYQSGGINESFSDMAGEIIEYYMNSQAGKENDWLVGDSIVKGPIGTAMRYFADPTRDGRSIDNADDYYDGLDVHYSSGVFNKAYYTLAHQPNWTIRKAFDIFLLANQVYWESDATFDSAACGATKAAADLGYDTEDVISSFKEVGVNARCAIDPDPGTDEVILENGQVVSNISMSANKELRYALTVPVLPRYPYNYKYLYVRLFDEQNDSRDIAELYVRYSPETSYKQALFNDNDEYFFIQYPMAGTYHILLKGKTEGSVNLQAFYGR